MIPDSRFRFLESASARVRLAAAAEFVRSHPAGTEILIVGATRDAVDDFVRAAAGEGATFGLHRFSFWQLVSTLAAVEIATERLAPATPLAAQSVAARAAFEARERGLIPRLEDVSRFPGFPAALAATLEELRLEGVGSRDLRAGGAAFADLAALADRFETEIEQARIADRAKLLKLATWAWRRPQHASLRAAPLLLLDLPVSASLAAELLRVMGDSAPAALATVPAGDVRTRRALERMGAKAVPAAGEEADAGPGDAPAGAPVDALQRLRRWLFQEETPPPSGEDDSVRFFSAPGEARECVEIARLIGAECRRGVRLDEIAVFLRSPELYSSHLETALRRADIPAYFTRGTTRPDPAGRAFLALLACAGEQLSARRFAEYLSFAQVPELGEDGAPPPEAETWIPAREETLGAAAASGPAAPGGDGLQLALPFGAPEPETKPKPAAGPAAARAAAAAAKPAPAAPDDPDPAQAHGSLRAPWKWEHLLVEAAVIKTRERWERRLRGLQAEFQQKIDMTAADEPGSPRLAVLRREAANLGHLERFALPVVEALAALPREAVWGDWLHALSRLAPRVLRSPVRVLEVLAELRPMADVGPVALDEVRAVLTDRLATLEEDPPATRYGSVFVATPEAGRGRSFRVVFAPGLAERVFPRRPREDPLLLDDARAELSDKLKRQDDRDRDERMLLRLIVGAAEERLLLSYPRLEVAEARPRVPSFYGLDVARAVRGVLPDHSDLERDAEREVQARLAWPGPPDPAEAIDAVEHDLAVLDPLLHGSGEAKDRRGRARYLLELNPHLARSLRSRYVRWRFRKWDPADGIVRITDATRPALAAHQPGARAYSVTALENFAACPYRFLLSAVHRLEPREEPTAPVQLDPLTKGRLVHEVQAAVLRELRSNNALPVRAETVESATRALDRVLDEIAGRYDEDLAPAIPRVWRDEVGQIRADLRMWLRRMARDGETWIPRRFEMTFGLPRDGRPEPGSVPDPVELPGGWKLRGAIDLVEERADGTALRVTDHKTGADRTNPGFVVGGGETLQPVLYSLVVEAMQDVPVAEARLSFCTSRGGFQDRTVEINEWSRLQGRQALATIARALEEGLLVPSPRRGTWKRPGACAVCDFRVVCGPHEERRSGWKTSPDLEQLTDLRELP
jgi:CRISPR/Cas system-associated exonuclease Cas4 (RecB family)